MDALFAPVPPELPLPIAITPLGHEPAEVARRVAEWRSSLKPTDPADGWLAERFGTLALELEQLLLKKAARRMLLAKRAELCWELDRQAEAEERAAGLRAAPALTLAQLRRTLYGVLWLLGRWRALKKLHEARPSIGWGLEHRREALDLLGVPTADRGPATEMTPDRQRATADEQIAALESLAERLRPLDALERQVAMSGLDHDPSAEGRELRRWERAIERDMHWCLSAMRDQGGRNPTRGRRRPATPPRDEAPEPPRPAPAHPAPGPLASAARAATAAEPRNRAERRALDRLLRRCA